MKKSLVNMYLTCILTGFAWSQDTRPTVAILDFEGQGISVQEVQTLTERMRSETGATNAVRLIERKAIESIMAEQGLAQSGCVSDECAAEVGQLLGVQFMVSGTIGKLGDTYTIDVKMFSVETGATIRSSSKTHKGDVDGLLVIIEVCAWELVGLQPPADLLARVESGAQVVAAPGAPKKPMSKGAKRLMWTVLILGGGLGGAYAAGLFDTPPVPLPEPPILPGG